MHSAAHVPAARRPPRLLQAAVCLLVVIGIAAALGRSLFVDDLLARIDPFRGRILSGAGLVDPFAAQRPAEVVMLDDRFASHRLATLLHVLPGAVFLALATVQFSRGVRGRYPALHRWNGRLVLLAGLLTALPGFCFGLLMPYGGWGEAAAIATFGGFFVYALARGFVAIRSGDVARHREWMIRAFAAGLGIATVRVVSLPLDLVLTPLGYPPRTIFVLSLWAGWAITLAAAERWLLRGRAVPVTATTGRISIAGG